MADEENTEHIVNLTLVPVGSVVEGCDGWDRLCLVGVGLDSYAGIVADTEQVVHNLESLIATWEVNCCDIGNSSELGGSVVPVLLLVADLFHGPHWPTPKVAPHHYVLEPSEDWNNARWWDVDGQLVLPDAVLLDVFREARENVCAVFMHLLGSGGVFVGWVLNSAVQRLRLYSNDQYTARVKNGRSFKVRTYLGALRSACLAHRCQRRD